MARAFVIRPFRTKTDSSGRTIDFERVHELLIAPALQAADLGGSTTGELVEPGNIREDMFALILEADLVVCDVTVHNANVFYELGIRHALRKRRTILIKGRPGDDIPFDVLTDRYLAYDIDDPAAALPALRDAIAAALLSERPADSPIFKMLPGLPEADPAHVVVVPLDFSEEVGRARTALSRGWLRLLSEEVRNQRFQWQGLKLVAKVQWDLKDYEGARASWEAVRSIYPSDIEANLALANVYERLYRASAQETLLQTSDQAIDRVLRAAALGREQRAEALALRGRNEKTRWRLAFRGLKTLEERREAAMDRRLMRAYEAYRDAFAEDLNHFFPGLNALQLGMMLLDLAKSDAWYDDFDSNEQADSFRTKLEREVAALRAVVPFSVSAAARRLDERDPARFWAEISQADVLFSTDGPREKRVIDAYLAAIPQDQPFAWDATRGQLELFAELGIQADLAAKVIAAVDARFAQRAPGPQGKPVHLLVFAGHRVDAPDRAEPRFPAAREDRARQLLHELIQELIDPEHETRALASAAPGTDILAHEICAQLGLSSTLCLPLPAPDFARLAFAGLDDWRARFLGLERQLESVVLGDREGPPKWQHERAQSAWERGIRWTMKMAQTWGAERITLVVLWDGKEAGDAPGGTAQMVKLAEEAGCVRIVRIDAVRLLT